ncbi:MAG TPA: hypothetical protein DDZ79_08860, partial [Aequorivita sp.]|nr:hypothetical protein [Aequorivita sp.]
MTTAAFSQDWEVVGIPGFSAGIVQDISLVFNTNGEPYVAYRDGGNSLKATVMRHNGNNWTSVGTAGFTPGEVSYTSLVIDNSGTPYIAYSDSSLDSKATVMKFDGTNWVVV